MPTPTGKLKREIRDGGEAVTKTEGDPLGALDVMGEGVLGYTVEHEDATYIPLIVATHPGTGEVGRWLDELSGNVTWKIPTVVSGRLAGMLERRGWVLTVEHSEEFGAVEVYVRRARWLKLKTED
jgi:hypothetical protein